MAEAPAPAADEAPRAADAAAGAGEADAKEPEIPVEERPYEERSVAGRIALITGASRGLGRQLAVNLATRGIGRLVLLARSAAGLAESAKVARDAAAAAEGVDADALVVDTRVCDLADPAAIKAVFEGIAEAHPHLDIVVNNAGLMPGYGQPPGVVPDEKDLACLNVNVIGCHFVTKYALPMLLASPAGFQRTVLFTGSNEGWLSEPPDGNGMLAYRASKAAVNGIMVALHQTYVSDNMQATFIRGGADVCLHRVVSAHPGFTQTALGLETESEMEPDLSPEELARRKGEDAEYYVPLEVGCDTLTWCICAADGEGVESGKTYYKREMHSF